MVDVDITQWREVDCLQGAVLSNFDCDNGSNTIVEVCFFWYNFVIMIMIVGVVIRQNEGNQLQEETKRQFDTMGDSDVSYIFYSGSFWNFLLSFLNNDDIKEEEECCSSSVCLFWSYNKRGSTRQLLTVDLKRVVIGS